MWIVKAALLFLVFWGVWYVCWTVILVGSDISSGSAPLPVTAAAIVLAVVIGRILERKREGEGTFECLSFVCETGSRKSYARPANHGNRSTYFRLEEKAMARRREADIANAASVTMHVIAADMRHHTLEW
jgi:hypothetical protein